MQIKLSEQSITSIILFIIAYLVGATIFIINIHNRVALNTLRHDLNTEVFVKMVNNLESIKISTHNSDINFQILNTKFENFLKTTSDFREDMRDKLKEMKDLKK